MWLPMLSTQSARALQDSCLQEAANHIKVSDAVLHLLPKFPIKLSEKYPTGVADSSFQLVAVLIVPLGCVSRPLNVYLHTVLTGYGIWLC